MIEGDQKRIASSELENPLLGNTSKYRDILIEQKENLKEKYPDPNLIAVFDELDSRIISLAPMALFESTLRDLGIESDEKFLAGLGLVMYSVSTYDDVIDERPTERIDVASLIFAGDITTLEGMRLLTECTSSEVISEIVKYLNLTNIAQTKIIRDLWEQSSDEETYLDAINTTRYWAEVGIQAAITFANRPDLSDFVDEFSIFYGKTCQIFDDVREIDDDLKNGYWSLPISLAHQNKWDLNTPEGKNKSIQRSREIAKDYIERATSLCGDNFPNLKKLVERLNVGFSIVY